MISFSISPLFVAMAVLVAARFAIDIYIRCDTVESSLCTAFANHLYVRSLRIGTVKDQISEKITGLSTSHVNHCYQIQAQKILLSLVV